MAQPKMSQIEKYHPESISVLGELIGDESPAAERVQKLEDLKDRLEKELDAAKAELENAPEPSEEEANDTDDVDENDTAMDYSSRKLDELRQIAEENNVDISDLTKKADIVAKLEEALG